MEYKEFQKSDAEDMPETLLASIVRYIEDEGGVAWMRGLRTDFHEKGYGDNDIDNAIDYLTGKGVPEGSDDEFTSIAEIKLNDEGRWIGLKDYSKEEE